MTAVHRVDRRWDVKALQSPRRVIRLLGDWSSLRSRNELELFEAHLIHMKAPVKHRSFHKVRTLSHTVYSRWHFCEFLP